MVLSKEVISKACKRAEEARKGCVRVEFAGLKLFERHCGRRMARVRVFNKETSPEHCPVHKKNEVESWDELVCTCPDCNYSITNAPVD